MIDWLDVAFNALWMLGASVVVAACSYHHWRVAENGRSQREIFRNRSFRLISSVGMMLVCVGWLLGQAQSWRARLVCGLLVLLCAWVAFVSSRRVTEPGNAGVAGRAS